MNAKAVDGVTWAITDGRAGMRNQARGLAEAIGLPVAEKEVHPRLPWTLFPVTAWPSPFAALGANSSRFEPPWPRVAIGCGWRSIPYVLALKKLSPQTLTVQLQDPRIGAQRFDLVVPPEHDQLAGANVVSIIGSPNGVTKAKLDAARQQWTTTFGKLKQPRVAVLIGGASKSHRFAEPDAQHLAEQLKELARNHGLMITTSRRTGDAQTKILKDALENANAFVWNGAGDNPFLGMLSIADAILVTSDSTNMAVEAATTGKPVYIVRIPGGDAKFDRLHERLKSLGIARDFEGRIEQWTYTPLNETARIAALIRHKIGLDSAVTPA